MLESRQQTIQEKMRSLRVNECMCKPSVPFIIYRVTKNLRKIHVITFTQNQIELDAR